MIGHHIGHVLENLQVLNLQFLTIFRLSLIGFFQLGQILENIQFELCPVQAGDRGRGTEGYLFPADL